MTARLSSPFSLPCGLVLPNRVAKAAMTEQLSRDGDPNARLERLYQRFCAGGSGLVITGNAMVDRDQREHPRNVILDDKTSRERLASWARACEGAPTVVQLNHPGRQALSSRTGPVAPSPIALRGLGPFFRAPRALGDDEVERVLDRFVLASTLCEAAGFRGVQLHAAHGYLLSQFLSPRTNQRSDRWGGSLENRARALVMLVERVRAAVKPGFAVMVKLNSADFQRGGFADDDAIDVMRMLEGKSVDLLEISGGSYESPAMVGRASSLAREAYFLEFAERARKRTSLRLMVTGGFRTASRTARTRARRSRAWPRSCTRCGWPAPERSERSPGSQTHPHLHDPRRDRVGEGPRSTAV
jgi:2,4-dienoyl-CoA reductase-like NADH-dependent reductase (Old Yellow Enzyme family)